MKFRVIDLLRERSTISSPQFMLTVMWTLSRFHVLEARPKSGKLNTDSCTNKNLVTISDWKRLSIGTESNKLWIHSDNARPSSAKVSTDFFALNRMKKMPYRSHSPDLGTLKFFLFAQVERILIWSHANSLSELLVRVRIMLSGLRGRNWTRLTRLHGEIIETYRQQWRGYWMNYKNVKYDNSFYSTDSLMLHLGWDTLYIPLLDIHILDCIPSMTVSPNIRCALQEYA
jgi:hypothetical protein